MRNYLMVAAMALSGAHAAAADPVGKMFAKRCATCHTVPDPAIRTDLAWLDQINRTW
jgi:cytochrome c2